MVPVRLEPATQRSRVMHSATEPGTLIFPLYVGSGPASTVRGDRGWLMHFLVSLVYLVNGMTKYDHFCMC